MRYLKQLCKLKNYRVITSPLHFVQHLSLKGEACTTLRCHLQKISVVKTSRKYGSPFKESCQRSWLRGYLNIPLNNKFEQLRKMKYITKTAVRKSYSGFCAFVLFPVSRASTVLFDTPNIFAKAFCVMFRRLLHISVWNIVFLS